MFNRRAIEDIKAWYQQNKRKPLVIRGARQVGKTTAVRLAAEQLSVKVIEINLERHTELEPLFQGYKLDELLTKLAFRAQTVVFAGATLRGQGARGQICNLSPNLQCALPGSDFQVA